MLLKGYRKHMLLPRSDPEIQDLHCVAYLDEDITQVLPYLNTEMGGYHYTDAPASLMLKTADLVIVLYSRKITISNIKDEDQAEAALRWLQNKINYVWKKRRRIRPSYEPAPRPTVLEILKLIGKSNCNECGEPSCVLLAAKMAEGAKRPNECRTLSRQKRDRLNAYLDRFDPHPDSDDIRVA